MLVVDEYVIQLEIPVDDVVLVEVVDGLEELGEVVETPTAREHPVLVFKGALGTELQY